MPWWLLACASPPPADGIADAALVDQDGKRLHLSDFDDRWLLIGFVYTGCAEMSACPLTTARMREVQARSDHRLHLLSITIDPEHDTPERLKAYALANGADLSRWTFAAAPGLPDAFNVLALPQGDAIAHTVKVALLAPGRRPVAEWKDEAIEADAILRAIK